MIKLVSSKAYADRPIMDIEEYYIGEVKEKLERGEIEADDFKNDIKDKANEALYRKYTAIFKMNAESLKGDNGETGKGETREGKKRDSVIFRLPSCLDFNEYEALLFCADRLDVTLYCIRVDSYLKNTTYQYLVDNSRLVCNGQELFHWYMVRPLKDHRKDREPLSELIVRNKKGYFAFEPEEDYSLILFKTQIECEKFEKILHEAFFDGKCNVTGAVILGCDFIDYRENIHAPLDTAKMVRFADIDKSNPLELLGDRFKGRTIFIGNTLNYNYKMLQKLICSFNDAKHLADLLDGGKQLPKGSKYAKILEELDTGSPAIVEENNLYRYTWIKKSTKLFDNMPVKIYSVTTDVIDSYGKIVFVWGVPYNVRKDNS